MSQFCLSQGESQSKMRSSGLMAQEKVTNRRQQLIHFLQNHTSSRAPSLLAGVSEEVLEIAFHKVRSAMLGIAPEERAASVRWLKQRNYRLLQSSSSEPGPEPDDIDVSLVTYAEWHAGPSPLPIGDWHDVRRYLPGPKECWKFCAYRRDGAGLFETPQGLIIALSAFRAGGRHRLVHASVARQEGCPSEEEAARALLALVRCGPFEPRRSPLASGEYALQRHFFGPVRA